ncbi:MAG: glycosyltransferase family 2 protein [Chloroflexota bacterium]|nr:glycosyltransferase family 2 protein [Chloroflexota bacterium]
MTTNLAQQESTPLSHDASPGEIKLSVVVPVYNETGRMGKRLPELLDFLHAQDYSYEVVVVDDGSSDGTAELARQMMAREARARVLPQPHNRGKGHAVRVGMLAAEGRFVLFTDADLSTPPSELDKFWRHFDEGYDVVIGSRKMPGANIVKHQPLWRESLGKVFTWLTNHIATKGISDVTCGFKCFRLEAAHKLFGLSVIDDWSFDAEVLFLAQRLGYRIKEVPVTWHDNPGTKVRLWKDAVNSLRGLVRIRLNASRGAYRAKQPAARKT